MNNNDNGMTYWFHYRNKYYTTGTKFIYSGLCELNGEEVRLTNQECEYLYSQNYREVYFKSNDIIYVDKCSTFSHNIIKIIVPPKMEEKEEFYFTDKMVVNTIWYVIIMLIGTICYGRVLIWIIATLIYFSTTFRKK